MRKGEPIFATDIENVITRMEGVREVAVIGVEDVAEGQVRDLSVGIPATAPRQIKPLAPVALTTRAAI
jgi:acyl-CoA synthetase (AMP-forming)/AMP-acid ligase II